MIMIIIIIIIVITAAAVIVAVVKRKKHREEDKTQERQVMQMKITAHHQLTNVQQSPGSGPPASLPLVLLLSHMVWNIPLVSWGQPSQLCPLPTSCAPPALLSSNQNIPPVINTIFSTNTEHSHTQATMKTYNSIPSKTSTIMKQTGFCTWLYKRILIGKKTVC